MLSIQTVDGMDGAFLRADRGMALHWLIRSNRCMVRGHGPMLGKPRAADHERPDLWRPQWVAYKGAA